MAKVKTKIDDGFNPELVETAFFDGELEIPIVKDTNPPLPTKVIPFSQRNKSTNYDEYIVFYENDLEFGDVLVNPDAYIEEFKKFKGIISLDNSVYIDSPLTVQIGNVYKSRALAHYFQEHDINVIPNCRWGDERSYTTSVLPEKFAFLGIPKHSIVAIGTYGCNQGKEEKHYLRDGLRVMLDEIEPRCVIVYGSMPAVVFEEFKEKTKFIQFDDWTTQKRRKHHGNN